MKSSRVAMAALLGAMLLARPALAQMDALLAQVDKEPSIYRQVTPEEIERLKRQITEDTRSSVEVLGEGHYESGDLNERLYFFRVGAGLNYPKLRRLICLHGHQRFGVGGQTETAGTVSV